MPMVTLPFLGLFMLMLAVTFFIGVWNRDVSGYMYVNNVMYLSLHCLPSYIYGWWCYLPKHIIEALLFQRVETIHTYSEEWKADESPFLLGVCSQMGFISHGNRNSSHARKTELGVKWVRCLEFFVTKFFLSIFSFFL